jgi:hypothetical protein
MTSSPVYTPSTGEPGVIASCAMTVIPNRNVVKQTNPNTIRRTIVISVINSLLYEPNKQIKHLSERVSTVMQYDIIGRFAKTDMGFFAHFYKFFILSKGNDTIDSVKRCINQIWALHSHLRRKV